MPHGERRTWEHVKPPIQFIQSHPSYVLRVLSVQKRSHYQCNPKYLRLGKERFLVATGCTNVLISHEFCSQYLGKVSYDKSSTILPG